MTAELLHCPNCGAPHRSAQAGEALTCEFCHARFVVSTPPRGAQVNGGDATQGRPAAGTGGAAIGLLVILVVAIVAALIARAASSRKSAEQARVGADEAPAPPLEAEIVRYTEGTTSIGARFFLVEVKNTGSVELAPTVVVSGFDANGTRVVETKGYSRRGALQPGAIETVLARINEKPTSALARVEVVVAPTAPFIKTRSVTVAEITEQPSYGSMHQLVGTVVNQTRENVQNVQVIAVGRDASGKPVAFGEAYASTTSLAPGARSGFRISGTWEVSRPMRWEASAFGN